MAFDFFGPGFGSYQEDANYLRDQQDEDPERFGVLQDMYGGDVTKTLEAYNWGEGGYSPVPDPVSRPSKLSIPLPDTGTLPPSGYGTEAPSYSPLRDQDLTRVNSDISGLEGQKTSALEALKSGGNLEPDQALAIALTAIVPTLLGFGFGGGLQGGAVGAQAGAAGAGVGLKGFGEEKAKRDVISKLLYEDANSKLSKREADATDIRKAMATADEKSTENDKLYGPGGYRRTGSSGLNAALTPQQVTDYQGMGIPAKDGWTQRDVSNWRSTKSESRLNSGLEERQRQFDTKQNNIARGQQFVGYQPIDPNNSPILSPTELKDMRTRQRGTYAMIDNLDQQKELVSENGSLDFTGTEAALEGVLQGDFLNLGRIRTNSGANFTALEMDLVSRMQAATAAGGSPIRAVMNMMTDRDPVEVMNAVQGLLQRNLDAEMLTYKQQRPGASYNPGILERMGLSTTTGGGGLQVGGGTGAERDLTAFIADAKARGLSKDQAKAEWASRGGK